MIYEEILYLDESSANHWEANGRYSTGRSLGFWDQRRLGDYMVVQIIQNNQKAFIISCSSLPTHAHSGHVGMDGQGSPHKPAHSSVRQNGASARNARGRIRCVRRKSRDRPR